MTAKAIDPAVLAEQRLASDLTTLDFATVFQTAAERTPAGGRPHVKLESCRMCGGSIGPVIDSTELFQGVTFVTAHAVERGTLELRQISSSRHRDDLDTVPPMDAITIFERLSKVERFLLSSGDSRFPETGEGRRGHVTITKSRAGGGHGFQRLRLHAAEPPTVVRERARVARHGAGLPALLETRSPKELLVGEFRGGVAAAMPANPRRAFETIVYLRPSGTGLLCDLTGNQRWGLAQAMREITGALRLELSVRGLPVRYSWRFVAGAGLEPYLRIVAPRDVTVHDGPAEWVGRLRAHIGVE